MEEVNLMVEDTSEMDLEDDPVHRAAALRVAIASLVDTGRFILRLGRGGLDRIAGDFGYVGGVLGAVALVLADDEPPTMDELACEKFVVARGITPEEVRELEVGFERLREGRERDGPFYKLGLNLRTLASPV
jgi:hypothetical protein